MVLNFIIIQCRSENLWTHSVHCWKLTTYIYLSAVLKYV